MPRESKQAQSCRAGRIVDRLRRAYPEADCALLHSSPLELLIATILSAQCTDKQVNLVTPKLFRKYKSASDYAQTPVHELEQDIRSLGFFRAKARHIQAACRKLVECHEGQVPPSMDALLELDGVGRKTANVVLGNAFQIQDGVVVDTHVARLAQRLRLTRHHDPVRIEQDLMQLLNRDLWTLFSHWLIWHGRRRCSARKPDCPHCELLDLCPTGFSSGVSRRS